METRRSSSRIRKPTLKLIENKLDSGSVPRTQHKNDKTLISGIDNFKDSAEKTRGDHKSNHNQQDSTKLNCHNTDNEEKAVQTSAAKSQPVKRSRSKLESEQTILRHIEKPADVDEGRHDLASDVKEIPKLEANSEVKTVPVAGSSVAKAVENDLKAVRKCTVRFLLKEVVQNQKKAGVVNNKIVEEPDKAKQKIVTVISKQHLDDSNKSTKIDRDTPLTDGDCKQLDDDKVKSDALKISKGKAIFKEDGSLFEECGSDADYKHPRSPETGMERKESTKDEVSDNNESIEEYSVNEEESEDMTSDVEAQIKAEFDEYAETAELEEVDFDFDEGIIERSLECPVCHKVLSNRCNLKKHLSLHRADKPFQCEICGMSFAIQAYLRIHSLVHSGKRKHKCDTCGKCFLRRSNLNTHRRIHTDVKAFPCEVCDKKFKTKLGRDSHMREHVTGRGYTCTQCGKSFSQQSYLQRHISVHKGEKPFQCMVCGKSFPYNQSLQEHMRRHTGEKPEVCDKCGKGFNNKRQLKAHMKYHNTVSEFACEECHVFYDSQQSLNKHITKTHNRKHECDYCKQSFVNKKHLRTHQAMEHKDLVASSRRIPPTNLAKAKKVECTLCNKVFFNRYVLSKHLMSKHQLSEKDMKELLQIRKKAISRKQIEKYKINDPKDFSKLLENDKSFRVYYKDDEMAVYVKGTDSFDTRLKGTTEVDNVGDTTNASNQDVSYVVYEDTNDVVVNDLTEYTEMRPSNDSNEVIKLPDSVIQSIQAVTEEEKMSACSTVSNVIKEDVVNTGSEGQNYYVVFTDTSEASESTVKVLDNKFVRPTEIHDLHGNDDETERIVLILNEGEGGKNIMLENGEQYEIVTDDTDILQEEIGKQEYEVVATGPVTSTDEMSYEESFELNSENIVEANKDNDTYASAAIQVGARNLPLLEQLQTQEILHDMESHNDKNERTERGSIVKEIDKESKIVQHFTDDNEMITESVEIQYPEVHEHQSGNLTLAEENVIVIPAMEGAESVSIMSTNNIRETTYTEEVNTDPQTSRSSLDDFVPKRNTVQEFTNFENAVKSKLGDFQNQDDYNDFLDKMIQTLQNAKHKDPE